MKRILLILVLIPHLAWAQYNSSLFTLESNDKSVVKNLPMEFNVHKDTTIAINVRGIISGLSVSGKAMLDNNNDSHIRITLEDDYNYEHLIYETFPVLANSQTDVIQNTGIETLWMEDIIPKSITISIKNATLQLNAINYLSTPIKERVKVDIAKIHNNQCHFIAEKLNNHLEKRHMTWRAGLNSMALKSYEEKKSMFAGKMPVLHGFDYYKGGIFIVPDNNHETSQLVERESSVQYVDEWDWRNRHGQNWMTPVKAQLDSTCWAFSAVGALEAYINLYYNRHLDYNLSEQELRSCSTISNDGSGNFFRALEYVRLHGLVLEDCFPYVGHYVDCTNKCTSPTEQIIIQSRKRILAEDENLVKNKLFVAPVLFTIKPWEHQVVLAGYKTVHFGDVIYNGNTFSQNSIIVDSTNTYLINKTAWLIKNSYGSNWGDSGYAYVVAYPMEQSCYIHGSIYSMIYNDNDKACKDEDGDGYYFWGIGTKPPYCPSWIPDTPDGDDSNASNGSLDVYGFLEHLNPDTIATLLINSNIEYNTRQSVYSHIRITQNGTLTVKDVLNLFGHVTITIENGGKLIIDGGIITNAHIVMNTGSQLVFLNDGLLICRTNCNFTIPSGAILEMEYGKICQSHDF